MIALWYALFFLAINSTTFAVRQLRKNKTTVDIVLILAIYFAFGLAPLLGGMLKLLGQ